MKKLTIGVDIGGTRTKVGLVDVENGLIIARLVYPTETKDGEKFLDGIGKAINTLKASVLFEEYTISGIGFGIPGFVFSNGVVDSTYGFLEFMEDYPLKQLIAEKYELQCLLDNDARVVALGEALYGGGKEFGRVLVLTLGTGLGIGFTINGKLNEALPYAHMAGHIKVTDNEVLCYCGKTGCLEALVSATGLCNAAKNKKWELNHKNIPLTAENLFKARDIQNQDAISLINDLLAYLKTGIDNYINLFAPDVVLLGGGLARGLKNDLHKLHDHTLLNPYKKYRAVIKSSVLEEDAGILGSAALFNHGTINFH